MINQGTRLASAAPHLPLAPASGVRVLVAATIGNAFEYFDLTVFSFFAVIIGKSFFPAASGTTQILLSSAAFGVGYLTRPLGAAVFGYIADRHGRLRAMRATLLLMGAGTGIIAVTPSYQAIGIAAPVLIVLARMLQGLSAGGEIGPATALMLERSAAGNRGFITSWQFASQGGAAMLGALVSYLLSKLFAPETLEVWAWRIPFAFGVLVAPVGLWLRAALHVDAAHESAASLATQRNSRRNPLLELIRNYPGTALITFLLVVSGTATQSIVLFYLPTYAVTQLKMPVSATLACAIGGGLLVFIMAPIGGVLSDRFGRKLVSQITRIVIALLVYPAFVLLQQSPTTLVLFSSFAVLGALHGLNSGANGPMLAEAFPRHIRSTGMSVPYGLAVAIFGGFGPFIVTWLLRLTGNPLMPAWYVMACAVPAIVGIIFLRDMTGEALD